MLVCGAGVREAGKAVGALVIVLADGCMHSDSTYKS